ncbi:MAG TPA: phosphatase PAP2 family protein [Polyangiaceae bacterium]|nr:phosphatase PAP2 family protein [Polyangiaceae bacterium]
MTRRRAPRTPPQAALALALAALASLFFARPARAEGPGLTWQPEWRRAGPADYILTSALGAANLGVGLAFPGEREPSWTGRNDFDDGARDALRLRSRGARRWAGITSDIGWIGLTLYPGLVDSLLLATVAHKSSDVGWQLFVIYGESALTAGLVTVATQGLVGRARPLVQECGPGGEYDPHCGSRQQSRSFLAGHVSMSVNSAALTCVNQAFVPLYGRGAGGPLACAAVGLAAGGVSVLRIMADKHWASDVAAGAALGLATGALYPLALHYGFGGGRGAASAFRLTPIAGQGTFLALASGSF